MRQKLAVAATVGTLALAPAALEGGAAPAPAPMVQVLEAPGPRLRIVFPGYPADRWLRTWIPPSFYAGDRPVVRRFA